MARQSISLTRPNDEWLRAQVESEEFASKSEVVNDLIRRAREAELIREKLERAEQGGFTGETASQILTALKAQARRGEDL